MFNALSSIIMVASVVVFLSVSLDSQHHWQKVNSSSFSPWHVGHRTLDRTADTLTRAAFRPVFSCTGGSTGAGREIGIGYRKTPGTICGVGVISLFTSVLVSLQNLLPLPAFPSMET